MTVVSKMSDCKRRAINSVTIYICVQVLVYKDNIVKGTARSRITNVLSIALLSLLTQCFIPLESPDTPTLRIQRLAVLTRTAR